MDYFDSGTYAKGKGQTLWWSFYDRAILLNATLRHLLFIIPNGQGTPLKNLSDTNMTAAGQLPAEHKFMIRGIEIYYHATTAFTGATYQNFLDMLRTTTLTFHITSLSDQLQLNLLQLFGANLPQLINSVAGADQSMAVSQYKGTWELPIPITIAAKTGFDVEIQHFAAPNAALDADRIIISLVGVLDTGR